MRNIHKWHFSYNNSAIHTWICALPPFLPYTRSISWYIIFMCVAWSTYQMCKSLYIEISLFSNFTIILWMERGERRWIWSQTLVSQTDGKFHEFASSRLMERNVFNVWEHLNLNVRIQTSWRLIYARKIRCESCHSIENFSHFPLAWKPHISSPAALSQFYSQRC